MMKSKALLSTGDSEMINVRNTPFGSTHQKEKELQKVVQRLVAKGMKEVEAKRKEHWKKINERSA